MVHKYKSKSMMIMLVALLSSCSVTKMRYSRGFNVDFLSKNEKSDEAPTKANMAKKTKHLPNLEVNEVQPSIENTSLNAEIAPQLNLNEHSGISVPKTTLIETSRFWNRFYNQVDKVETKLSKFKPNNTTQKGSVSELKGDGSSGVWGILGFVFGLLGVWPLAIGFSIVGMGRNRNSRGLAITGLILGIIWMIISLAIVLG